MAAMTIELQGVRELSVDEIDEVVGALGAPGAIRGGILGFASGVASAFAAGGIFGDAMVGGFVGAGMGAWAGGAGNYVGLVAITFGPAGGIGHRVVSDGIDNLVRRGL